MSLFSAGGTAGGAGTSVRPIFGVLGTATASPRIHEIGLFNNTAVACAYRLVQVTGGTPGSTVTAFEHRKSGAVNVCLAKALWTADATVNADAGYRWELPAMINGSCILTMESITCDVGATVAFGLVPVGTGQVCDYYVVWSE